MSLFADDLSTTSKPHDTNKHEPGAGSSPTKQDDSPFFSLLGDHHGLFGMQQMDLPSDLMASLDNSQGFKTPEVFRAPNSPPSPKVNSNLLLSPVMNSDGSANSFMKNQPDFALSGSPLFGFNMDSIFKTPLQSVPNSAQPTPGHSRQSSFSLHDGYLGTSSFPSPTLARLGSLTVNTTPSHSRKNSFDSVGSSPFSAFPQTATTPVTPFSPLTPFSVRKGLGIDELKTMFMISAQHANVTRGRRDLAVLALIIDCKLSSGTIVKLTLSNIKSVVCNVLKGGSWNLEGHKVECSSASGVTSDLTLTAWTAWCLHQWIHHILFEYSWKDSEDIWSLPLFVNSNTVFDQGPDNVFNGQQEIPSEPIRMLKKIALKRDAISKIFASIKQRSHLNVNKNVVAASDLTAIEPVYKDWISILERDLMERQMYSK